MPNESLPENILVVVDPSQDEPLVIDRALHSASIMHSEGLNQHPKMHVFLCVDMDNVDTSAGNKNLRRDSTWFQTRIVEPLQKSNIQFTVEMSWSDDWYGAISDASERINADLIMLPMVKKPSASGRIFNESIWRLLRTAKCPVIILQPGAKPSREKTLAAVNFQSHKEEYRELNDVIIRTSHWIAKSYQSDLYVVNSYSDSLNYPDRSQLATKTQVDSSRIFVRAGEPDEVIASIAAEIDADMVVLGVRRRSSRWRGNTAEKIILNVDCDILAINQN